VNSLSSVFVNKGFAVFRIWRSGANYTFSRELYHISKTGQTVPHNTLTDTEPKHSFYKREGKRKKTEQ
jgi:hypothetical protein